MKAEELYKGVIEIDDRYIEEAQRIKLNKKNEWKRYAAIAACLCLAAISAVVVFHGKEKPAEVYHLSLLQDAAPGQEAAEICALSYTDQGSDLEHFVTLADGTTIPAVFIASSEQNGSDDAGMTWEEAQSFAYMDLDAAPEDLREIILKAREVIIYSRAWVADGLEAYVISPDGTRSALPAFSGAFSFCSLPSLVPFIETVSLSESSFFARSSSSGRPSR